MDWMKSPFVVWKWKGKWRAQLLLVLGWKSSSNRTLEVTLVLLNILTISLESRCVSGMPRFAMASSFSGEVQRKAVGEELQKYLAKPREGAEGWHMSFSVHQGDVLGRIICRIIWIMFTWFWTHNWQPPLKKMVLESPWTTLLKPQLSVLWHPESQENGEHPQRGSSSLVHPHLG